jgi:hypothetical protein
MVVSVKEPKKPFEAQAFGPSKKGQKAFFFRLGEGRPAERLAAFSQTTKEREGLAAAKGISSDRNLKAGQNSMRDPSK